MNDAPPALFGTAARTVAATAILVGGLVHLQLYFDGYRNLPDANLGRSFVLNGVVSAIVSIALLVRGDVIVRLAGIGISLGTLGAFAMSRTDRGVFGLRETGLEPSPQAAIALIVELLALGLLALSFLPAVGGGTGLPRRVLAPAAAVVGIGTIVLSVLWAQSDSKPTSAATPGSVAIAGFAFNSNELTVSAGTTVTWTNEDGFAHSVIGRDEAFASERLPTGASFMHTFDAAGTYAYICGIHPSMAGTVVVTE